MEILSSEYKSSSSSTVEEDEFASDAVLRGSCEDTSFSSDKTRCTCDLNPMGLSVHKDDVVQRALRIINQSNLLKHNNTAGVGPNIDKPLFKITKLEKPSLIIEDSEKESEKPAYSFSSENNGKVEVAKNATHQEIVGTKNAEVSLTANNDIELDHNCIENILGKPPIPLNTSENPESVFHMTAKLQTIVAESPKTSKTNKRINAKQRMSVHRGKPLGFGEKESLEDQEKVLKTLDGSLEGLSGMDNNEKIKTKENKLNVRNDCNNLDMIYWTGFDHDSYHAIEDQKAGFGAVRPTLILPSTHRNLSEAQQKIIPNTQTSDWSRPVHDGYSHEDFAVSTAASAEPMFNQHISVMPKIAVRVKNGVAKSAVEARLTEVEAFINNVNYEKRNWGSLVVPSFLSDVCDSIYIGCTKKNDGADLTQELVSAKVEVSDLHLYRLNSDGPLSQNISLDTNSDESAVGSQLWNLPCVEFENIWQNLFYNDNLKNEVMSYVYSLVRLSESGVDTNIITVHRMIMFLGPPGTGKTSLCRGLAQLLSIQLNDIYPQSVMVEINSHSLFSKWFSESGKLVQKMFDHIDDLAEDEKCMVFVLIDEIESLGMCRNNSSNRGDPADSIRAVNALITQIDRIRRRKNVLIMCTSNLEKCLDSALVDRVDFVRHVGPPSQLAMYNIIHDCITELQRIGIVDSSSSLAAPWKIGDKYQNRSSHLWTIASEAKGLSGRAMRQIPALVYAMAQENVMSVDDCLKYFRKAVKERLCRKCL